jgi:hypothetical protein
MLYDDHCGCSRDDYYCGCSGDEKIERNSTLDWIVGNLKTHPFQVQMIHTCRHFIMVFFEHSLETKHLNIDFFPHQKSPYLSSLFFLFNVFVYN